MKGKSTAAFGMALRAWNQGWPIAVFQFVKSAKWKVGEETALARARPAARADRRGRPGRPGTRWARAGRGSQRRAARPTTPPTPPRAGRRSSATSPPRRYGFYVLDEFTYPMKWGWVDVDEVVETLADRPGPPARRHHRPRRRTRAGRGRRPGRRDDQGQAPDGRRPEGPAGDRVVTASRALRRSPRPRSGHGQDVDRHRAARRAAPPAGWPSRRTRSARTTSTPATTRWRPAGPAATSTRGWSARSAIAPLFLHGARAAPTSPSSRA